MKVYLRPAGLFPIDADGLSAMPQQRISPFQFWCQRYYMNMPKMPIYS